MYLEVKNLKKSYGEGGSFQKLDVAVTADDHILTLSTCAGAAGMSKRRVIHAKLIGTSPD